MKKAQKKQLLNIVMVVLIAAIVFSGVMFAGRIRGWFADDSTITVSDKLGNANIEREGIAYSLTKGAALAAGDKVETRGNSTVTLTMTDVGSIILGENTKISITTDQDKVISIDVIGGEVFTNIETKQEIQFILNVNGRTITSNNAVFSLSAPSGSQSIYVYGGRVNFAADCISGETSAQAGQTATMLEGDSGETLCSLGTLTATALNDFLITQVKTANDAVNLCFTDEELDIVVAERQNELMAAVIEREAHEKELLSQGGNVEVPVEIPQIEDTDSKEVASTSGNTGSNSSGGDKSDKPSDDPNPTEKQPSAAPAPDKTPAPTSSATPAPDIYTCTISIRCDTILDNMENLVEGKAQYVPANGVILAASSVQFYDGETVFDVLKRTCKAAGIQIEYSYFPIYESYYIEGINHLYEFDCGAESGWMYKVNGWFPNYGCSAYMLEDSDTIVWCYTCNGLGEDVGGSVY